VIVNWIEANSWVQVTVTVLGAAFSVAFAGGVELAYWACA